MLQATIAGFEAWEQGLSWVKNEKTNKQTNKKTASIQYHFAFLATKLGIKWGHTEKHLSLEYQMGAHRSDWHYPVCVLLHVLQHLHLPNLHELPLWVVHVVVMTLNSKPNVFLHTSFLLPLSAWCWYHIILGRFGVNQPLTSTETFRFQNNRLLSNQSSITGLD